MKSFKEGQRVAWALGREWTGEVLKYNETSVIIHWSHPFIGKRVEPTFHPMSDFWSIEIVADPILESPPEDGEWE